jgi:hypothetical protein
VKLLREPLVHFTIIGAVIYLLYGIYAEPVPEADDKTLVVTSGEIEWMQTAWQKRWNRPPTAEELDGLVRQYIRETVLYREALTMGLNQHDTVIRRRLAQKLEFLAKDLVTLTPPTEEELRAYFGLHQQRYQELVRYSFTQIFLDRDKRGDATLDDAEMIKATLIAKGEAIEDAGALSEIGVPQHEVPLALFMFNVGVETGQLLFIAVVVTLMSMLRRLPLQVPQGAWRVLPYSIGSIAAFWTLQRVGSFI